MTSGAAFAVATARSGNVANVHLRHRGTGTALPGILADLAGRTLARVTASESRT